MYAAVNFSMFFRALTCRHMSRKVRLGLTKNTDKLQVPMEMFSFFCFLLFCYHSSLHSLFAVMSFQNELITAEDGSRTVSDGGGSQKMSDRLARLFTLDSEVFIY